MTVDTEIVSSNISTIPDTVNALAISPAFERDGVCFAAQNDALYRSNDGGRTWSSAYDSLLLEVPLTTTAVALSPTFAQDQIVFAGVNGGVLRSYDRGETWQVATLPDPPPVVTALAFSPNFAEDGVVFASTLEDGVYQSADRGNSWAAWNFGLLDLNVLALAVSPHFAQDQTVFACAGSGLFRSTNGGRAWREIALPVAFIPVLSVAIAPTDAGIGTLLVGTEEHGLFASTDEGRGWKRLGEDALLGAINSIVFALDVSDTPAILVLLNDTLVISRNGGESWSAWQAEDVDISDITAVAAPHGLGLGASLLVGLAEGGVVCI